MRGLISYCLYGDNPHYAAGILDNIQLAKQHYPGFEVLVSIESGHRATTAIRRASAIVAVCAPQPGHKAMFWRVDAADSDYDVILFRDADSRITAEEATAVRSWIDHSSTNIHSIAPGEGNGPLVYGGLWACRRDTFKCMAESVLEWGKYGFGNDQLFLADLIAHTPGARVLHAVVPGAGAKTKASLASMLDYRLATLQAPDTEAFLDLLGKYWGAIPFAARRVVAGLDATPYLRSFFNIQRVVGQIDAPAQLDFGMATGDVFHLPATPIEPALAPAAAREAAWAKSRALWAKQMDGMDPVKDRDGDCCH